MIRELMIGCCRALASLKLAVTLLVGIALVLAFATILEARKGTEYAYWVVYGSQWFVALWALLGLNILAATVIRFPWKWTQIGFLLAHVGVLLLLIGSLQTFLGKIEGRISLRENETVDSVLLPHRSQLTLFGHGESGQLSTEFTFSPGPLDWQADEALDFGRVGGVGVKVLAFYHHARPEVRFVRDESGRGAPALKLGLARSSGGPLEEAWCEANPFGALMSEGAAVFPFQQAPVAPMLEDFLGSPAEDLGEKGVLSVHYQGNRHQIPVDANVGKKVEVGDGLLSVEITDYYPNAVSEGGGRFRSVGNSPRNPMLQLKIYLPDAEEPVSEIAYAQNPFVSFALIHGSSCPVKFWYHHPAVAARPGAQFLQTPDEKLYCRVEKEGRYQPRGEVKVGDRIKISTELELRVLAYLPHARREVAYHPVQATPGDDVGFEAAALVELSVGDESHHIWLTRSDQPDAFRTVQTTRGPLLLAFGYERVPLGCSLKLLDFKRGMNPGRMGDQSYTSEVQLVDHTRGVDERRQIAMNQPMVHGRFTFYQSSFSEVPGEAAVSVFSVSSDPGRLLKYLGSLVTCVGIFFTYYMKPFCRRRVRSTASRGETDRARRTGRKESGSTTPKNPCAT